MTEEDDPLPPMVHFGSLPAPIPFFGRLMEKFSVWSNKRIPSLQLEDCIECDDKGGFTEIGSGMFSFVHLICGNGEGTGIIPRSKPRKEKKLAIAT